MSFQKHVPLSDDSPLGNIKRLSFSSKANGKAQLADSDKGCNEADVDIDLKEVYFLIMHFLSSGPCQRTYGQLWNELLEHQLLPRRYHAWYSRSGANSGDENDDGLSFPLGYNKLVERYPHVEKDHLVKLLKRLVLAASIPSQDVGRNPINAASVPTLLGTGSFSLLGDGEKKESGQAVCPPGYMRWPHMQVDQVRGLRLREIGGGFSRHHRAPSIRAACYAIAKPSTMVQKMQNVKRIRGHRNSVYCAIFDRSGRYVITGSDDRLVKIWSMETAYCLASCRGHEGDITDLAVSFNNALVASSSNDFVIRVWRLADGLPISVLRGHTGAVTAIAFSPRIGSAFQLLSSSDDGTCRIWDARHSQFSPRLYIPKPPDPLAGKSGGPSSSTGQQGHQIFCCAFNASGTIFVTGSSDTLARVWNACKPNNDDPGQPNHEMDILAGHENDVNYVQFSGCAVATRLSSSDSSKEDNFPKFKNTWYTHDNIVTCSRDGSAIIWIPKTRRSHGKVGRWTRAYHLKVPPPPMPPQPSRGGPRQRILPTPRGVNMIVWSLDNRFVLAAIMDCRICVWNAVDGSLVHSLTGHTASTYVLDVHPFNPRIAMSSGYDGKTIIWDIWEGKPIRVYEIGRFKLVDGKFSPDGTSIILSDDVGQLYILSTGQGESHKDAKYDQFFLGDYRPLIQDSHGNVLDQETQLAPYRRNMQDLLCDSGMIPYPEPYQSMYQKRRLGALGIEWRPSSLRFAVGTDITLDQEYQMPPIEDLDLLIDPLPELLDAMDWEPEVELLSDDNDSEYNVTEEYISAGEQGSLSSNSSGNLDCSEEDSEDDQSHEDGLRRSKRKKLKTDVEVVNSSDRHVKRRNLDEYGEKSSRRNKRGKSRIRRKASRKKSSTSKSLRPRRAAARNALNFFSHVTGRSSDGEDEDDGLEGNLSESESTQGSLTESEASEASIINEQNGHHSKGKLPVDLSEDMVVRQDKSESHMPAGNRKKLVFKLPIRDSNKSLDSQSKIVHQPDAVASSSSAPRRVEEISRAQPQSHGFDDGNYERSEMQTALMENHLSSLEGYGEGQIKWGGVKSRSSKRSRVLEPSCLGGQVKIADSVNGLPTERNFTISSDSDIQSQEEKIDAMNAGQSLDVSLEGLDGASNQEEQSESKGNDIRAASSDQYANPDNSILKPRKLRIKSSILPRAQENSTKIKIRSSAKDPRSSDITPLSKGPSEVPAYYNPMLTSSSNQIDSQILNSRNGMFREVYKRSKSTRSNGGNEASSSNPCGRIFDDGKEAKNYRRRRTKYMKLGSRSHDQNTTTTDINFGATENGSYETSTSIDGSSINGDDEFVIEDWRSSSRGAIGLRSTRSRGGAYNAHDGRSIDKKKTNQSAKRSWLLLSIREEGSRYIPQLGDEVVYLRQGHQDYIEGTKSREMGPWRVLKGYIRAVEICTVKEIEYSSRPGSGESCCKMMLQFVDPASTVAGKSFKLTLPELSGFPDFLVEKSRYDAAIERNWTYRDKCQVWWRNEDGEEEGSCWEGRIMSVNPKSTEFPDSPWEKFSVQYRNDPQVLLHSPWELYDSNVHCIEPHIDEKIRSKLLRALTKLEQSGKSAQDHYGVEKLNQLSLKSTYTNRFFVPLTLELIHSRLENNYYRRLAALKHDVEVMLENAESYAGRNTELSMKLKRLSDWFRRTLSTL